MITYILYHARIEFWYFLIQSKKWTQNHAKFSTYFPFYGQNM